jgi:hypothetical protein
MLSCMRWPQQEAGSVQTAKVMLGERAAEAKKMSVSHLEQGAQDVWEGALNKELVAVQHQLHLAIVPSRLPDKHLDLVRQLNLHAIPLLNGGSGKVLIL